MKSYVAPLAGAWIEINFQISDDHLGEVAPLAGAWIEIQHRCALVCPSPVAPLAGAWIEIPPCYIFFFRFLSLPSRERGLKYVVLVFFFAFWIVAPLAGAWIEI